MNNFLAQGVNIEQKFAPASKFSTLGNLINVLSKVVAIGGGFLVIAAFVYTAYLYMSSNGESKNIEKSKIVLTYALIGMILIIVAYWLTQIIARFIGTSF